MMNGRKTNKGAAKTARTETRNEENRGGRTMKTAKATMAALMAMGMWTGMATASQAETSAGVSGSRHGATTAEATARYDGDVGLARTDTRTGRISLARGLAVGLDRNGLTLSASHALGTRSGFGVARNFNLSIGRDGRVAVSGGRTVSYGSQRRSAEAGGVARAGHGRTGASSWAAGSSDRRGFVRTGTHARSFKPRPKHVRAIGRWLGRRLRR